ncbi:U4/U6 small nuclear ribonucleoprotein Prp4 [Borealophlyctis nickersoniae]|nr:U4/U6 small nuclear ribonucleoprotein Prp4 [Borealophlyctis nickersoniae]
MSDLSNLLNKPRIHFGSLEEAEQLRRRQGDIGSSIQVGGLTLEELADEDFEPSESTTKSQAEHQAILEEFERKKIARNLAVPTDDLRVRQRLRELGEPQTLFGEGPADRRDRLRGILSRRAQEKPIGGEAEEEEDESSDSEEEEVEEEFFTYGVEGLVEARRDICAYSVPRAKRRIMGHRMEMDVPFAQRKKTRHEWFTHIKTMETKSLQFGDERPLGYCVFSPNSKALATGSFSGLVSLWSVPNSEKLHTLKGHTSRVSGVAFHPESTFSQSPGALNLASGAVDGEVNLWSFDRETPIGKLEGHDMRVARLAFHPSGRYIGTASFDKTWRLWDVETQKELLMQEGHSREVFAIAFQDDGGLVASAGFDSVGRVWDLRTGRSIWTLMGHVKSILCLDWAPNGYQIATGSEDNTIRVWDVRQTKQLYVVPAHKNIVTQVRYWHAADNFEHADSWTWHKSDVKMEDVKVEGEGSTDTKGKGRANGAAPNGDVDIKMEDADDEEEEKGKKGGMKIGRELRRLLLDGSLLVSSSHDGTCKLWTDGDYKPIKALTGLEGKVMCCDLSGDGKYVATASYDRTFKLYSCQDS